MVERRLCSPANLCFLLPARLPPQRELPSFTELDGQDPPGLTVASLLRSDIYLTCSFLLLPFRPMYIHSRRSERPFSPLEATPVRILLSSIAVYFSSLRREPRPAPFLLNIPVGGPSPLNFGLDRENPRVAFHPLFPRAPSLGTRMRTERPFLIARAGHHGTCLAVTKALILGRATTFDFSNALPFL